MADVNKRYSELCEVCADVSRFMHYADLENQYSILISYPYHPDAEFIDVIKNNLSILSHVNVTKCDTVLAYQRVLASMIQQEVVIMKVNGMNILEYIAMLMNKYHMNEEDAEREAELVFSEMED